MLDGIWSVRTWDDRYVLPNGEFTRDRSLVPPMTRTLAIDLIADMKKFYWIREFRLEPFDVST